MWNLSNAFVTLDNPLFDLSGNGPVPTLGKIQDYPTLAQALVDFSHRTDIVNFQNYFIQFGELRIYRDIFSQNMGNGVQWMEATLSGVIDPITGFMAVPTGYLALKDAQVTDGAGDVFTLNFKDPQWIYANYPVRQASGLPGYIARDATNFVFGPFPDASYGVSGTFYAQSNPLTASNPQTWMTTYCPELLFAACMMELQPFLRDADGQGIWEAQYASKLTGLIDLDKSERLAAGAMSTDTA